MRVPGSINRWDGDMAYFDYNESGSSDSQSDQVTVLEGLSKDEWAMVISHARTIPFTQGEILLKEGEIDDAVYIVKEILHKDDQAAFLTRGRDGGSRLLPTPHSCFLAHHRAGLWIHKGFSEGAE